MIVKIVLARNALHTCSAIYVIYVTQILEKMFWIENPANFVILKVSNDHGYKLCMALYLNEKKVFV